jgi:hypothetical protein
MRTALITSAFICICAMQAGAADNNQQGTGKSIEQRKVEILKHIDQRISLSHQEKNCVQTAQSDTELRACWDKYRPVKKNDDRCRTNNQP